MSSGRAMAPILVDDVLLQLVFERVAGGDAFFQRDEGGDALALHFVRLADHGGFGHRGMIDQGAFDFHRCQMRWPATFMTSSTRPRSQK